MGRRVGDWWWFGQCLIGSKLPRYLAAGGPMERGLAYAFLETTIRKKHLIIPIIDLAGA
jgi:hypothetical protein